MLSGEASGITLPSNLVGDRGAPVNTGAESWEPILSPCSSLSSSAGMKHMSLQRTLNLPQDHDAAGHLWE